LGSGGGRGDGIRILFSEDLRTGGLEM